MTSDAPVLAALNSLVALATIWLAVFGVGRPLVRCLRLPAENRLDRAVWAAALGLAAIGWLFALLGWAGLLYPPVVGVLTLIAALWGLVELARVALEFRHSRRENRRRTLATRTDAFTLPWAHAQRTANRSSADTALIAVAALSTLAMLVCALAPTTSRQAISGSLEIAKEISLTHSLASASWGAPTLATMWFQWALVLDGPVAAGLVQWSLGLLTAGAAALLAEDLLGNRAGWAAAAIFLLAPGAQYQLAVPADDLAAAACGLLAIVAWQRALTCQRMVCWSSVAACMLGSALAIEAASIGIALGLGIATIWRAWRDPAQRPQFLRSLAILEGGACLLAACAPSVGWHVSAGIGSDGSAGIATEREAIASLGILLIALAPAATWLRPRVALWQMASLALIVSACGEFFFPQQRWWLLACPLCAVLAAHTWQLIAGFAQWPQRMAQAAIISLAVLTLRWPLSAAADRGRVAVGLESREAYLLRQLPEFAAIVVANSLVPAEGRLLADDRFSAYLRCQTTSAAETWQIVREPLQPAERVHRLRTSGITHVLLAQPDAEARLPIFPEDFTAGEPAASSDVLPLAEFRLTRRDASIWRYSLLKVR